jgi:hypothetical protein
VALAQVRRPGLLAQHKSPRRDERWALNLAEVDKHIEGLGTRRIQILRVVRENRVIDFERDMGPATAFKHGPILIMGATDGTDTVGELQDMADEERESTGLRDFLAQKAEESTLIADAVRVQEQMTQYKRRNARTVGRDVTARKGSIK